MISLGAAVIAKANPIPCPGAGVVGKVPTHWTTSSQQVGWVLARACRGSSCGGGAAAVVHVCVHGLDVVSYVLCASEL